MAGVTAAIILAGPESRHGAARICAGVKGPAVILIVIIMIFVMPTAMAVPAVMIAPIAMAIMMVVAAVVMRAAGTEQVMRPIPIEPIWRVGIMCDIGWRKPVIAIPRINSTTLDEQERSSVIGAVIGGVI